MRRLNVAFVAVVLAAAAVGGGAALQFHDDLGAVSTVVAVEDRIEVVVTDATLTDRGIEVSARVENPTAFEFRVPGGFVRAYNGSDAGLAFGSAERLDDNGVTLSAKGMLSVRLLATASPDQRQRLSAALETGEVGVTVTFPVYYGDARFTVGGRGTVDGGGS